ncbi:MAG: pyridoxal-phosphate dependent enzyme [Planctomycetota bacterium]
MPKLHLETPLIESRPFAAILGKPVWLKLECLQPVGSFKARGMGAACEQAHAAGAQRIVSSSGGNAGYAVARAARLLGLDATIIVPRNSSQRSRELIASESATLLEHGASWDDAHAHALELARNDPGARYVHPFDDPVVWRGHATLVEELGRQGPKPDALVVSVGGGGLLIGILEGLAAAGWGDVPILAVETTGAASYAQAIAAGELVTLDRIDSLAVTLGARTVAPAALDWYRRHPITPWTVSDSDAVLACERFADDHRLLVEPACGAALATLYDDAEPLRAASSVHVIACGGAGVDRALLQQWRARVDSTA